MPACIHTHDGSLVVAIIKKGECRTDEVNASIGDRGTPEYEQRCRKAEASERRGHKMIGPSNPKR